MSFEAFTAERSRSSADQADRAGARPVPTRPVWRGLALAAMAFAFLGLNLLPAPLAWAVDDAKKSEDGKSARSAKAAEDEAKDSKSAKSAKGASEDTRLIKGIKGIEEGKSTRTAKAGADETKAEKSTKAVVEEDPKGAKGGKAATDGKPSRAAVAADREDAQRLDKLGAKVNESFAKVKDAKASSPGSLTIRVQSPPGSGSASQASRSSAPRSTSAAAVQAAALAQAHRAAQAGHGTHAHWSYSGDTGPENWARMKPEYAKCVEGMRQSPINIRGGVKVDLEPIQFDYRSSTYSVIDNGHTVQVNMSSGNSISVMGRRYELLQFHFHRPAEERVDGRVYDMVAHLVHKDPEGRLAVVAVLMDRGRANTMLQSVWNDLPLERNEEMRGSSQIDLNDLLPLGRGYFTYMGSLTTPPCTEGVLWLVMKEPVTVSVEQIAIFSRLYPMNARPLQPISGRLIKESN